jgi:DNA-binding NarL/FixJ family response regulator
MLGHALLYSPLASIGIGHQGHRDMRLFIADSDVVLRVGLQLRLNLEPGIVVVGIAVHTNALLQQIVATEPDTVLLDWHLPGCPMDDVLAELNGLKQRPQIIVLSVQPEAEGAAIAAGADAFVAKSDPPDKLVEIVRTMRLMPSNGAVAVDG